MVQSPSTLPYPLPSPPDQPPPPRPARAYQFGALPLQLRLKSGPVGVKFGHSLQLIEHGGHIPRHVDQIGLRPLQNVLDVKS